MRALCARAALASILLATLRAGPAVAAAPARPPLCAGGRFVVEHPPLLPHLASDTLTLAPGQATIGDACPADHVRLVRTRRGTNVRVRWRTCGTLRAVRLRARIDTTCSVMAGVAAARRAPRAPFTAVCPACLAPATPFACLADAGPMVRIAGTHTTRWQDRALAPRTKLDARSATFFASPNNLYPIELGGGGNVCFAGGTVQGRYDRTLSWQAMHDLNNAGLRFENGAVIVDGLRVDNVEDGIRPVGGPFVIRQVWLSYIRDDCVENDHLQGGTIEDSLLDGCYTAISERPSPAIEASGADGRERLLTVRASLLRLAPMPGPRDGDPSDLGAGRFFKWDRLATQLALHDNVFLAEETGQNGPKVMGIPDRLVDCTNNVMVWLGPGDYPAPLPACFTVTRDRTVWDLAVLRWKLRHPHVGMAVR